MKDRHIFAFMAALLVFALCAKFACAEIGVNGFWSATESSEIANYGAYFSASGDDSKVKISGDRRISDGDAVDKYAVSYARLLERMFYKTRTAWNGSRDELSGGIDAGYTWPRVNASVGYEMSQIDDLHHLGALKLDFKILKSLKYSFHQRTDFGISGSRDWEWWQQVEYSMPLRRHDWFFVDFNHQCKIIYQLDRQFGFTEREMKIQFTLQGA